MVHSSNNFMGRISDARNPAKSKIVITKRQLLYETECKGEVLVMFPPCAGKTLDSTLRCRLKAKSAEAHLLQSAARDLQSFAPHALCMRSHRCPSTFYQKSH
ncbi:hypothetical protein SKAU_G00111180 [Synaphobranchus kaupii]|uniref:Uncharacterized protein n=1 Tax=Synaphobranchus kaupii TaxID=118154 RepID=A0A9Q1G0F8_SYNKA|nr:hypothetical protein SKAU_G00111180 [Synaphobranchus kaupii]